MYLLRSLTSEKNVIIHIFQNRYWTSLFYIYCHYPSPKSLFHLSSGLLPASSLVYILTKEWLLNALWIKPKHLITVYKTLQNTIFYFWLCSYPTPHWSLYIVTTIEIHVRVALTLFFMVQLSSYQRFISWPIYLK